MRIICGTCDYPASQHPVSNDYVTCNREPEDIGLSTWFDEVPTGTRFFTVYPESEGSYIEALKVFDLGVAKRYSIHRTIDKEFSDYIDYDGNAQPVVDYQGQESLILEKYYRSEDEFDHIDYTLENNRVENWRDITHQKYDDTDSWVCTSILGEEEGEYTLTQKRTINGTQRSKQRTSPVMTESERSAYVENNDGFIARSVIDPILTQRHHEHILNMFRDKTTQEIRVGSIRFINNTNGTLTAKCVNNNCSPTGRRASLTIDPNQATREQMEHFVWSVISHGNNHAASWYTKRPEFYPLHHLGCNLNTCLLSLNPKAHSTCTNGQAVLSDSKEVDDYEFLTEHKQYCSDSNCKCTEVMSNLLDEKLANLHSHFDHVA